SVQHDLDQSQNMFPNDAPSPGKHAPTYSLNLLLRHPRIARAKCGGAPSCCNTT
ncbi:hypothetical protein L9F63_007985, partial [Diploptera punctata]